MPPHPTWDTERVSADSVAHLAVKGFLPPSDFAKPFAMAMSSRGTDLMQFQPSEVLAVELSEATEEAAQLQLGEALVPARSYW